MHFSNDSLINAIYQNVKKGIQTTFDSECYGSCLILIYCGIDAMSYLDMPQQQIEVDKKDFIRWAQNYLSPKLSNEITQITGEELYNARCALVHTYGLESRGTKGGSARIIGYMVGGNGPIQYNPRINKSLVMLPLEKLKEAFFKSIDEFLMKSYADLNKRYVVQTRVETLAKVIHLENIPRS